jgi:16S rRNA pseudouridine516 synthase
MTVSQFIAKHSGLGKRHAKKLIDAGQVFMNHQPISDGNLPLGKFDHLSADGEILQARIARYLLLHKPIGILSATSDKIHRTVIDLVNEPWAGELHLAGRLDRATSGLVILTNDSHFSESLTSPVHHIPKTYLVHADQPIPENVLRQFRDGMSFDKENTRSAPAVVELLSETSCRLTIHEGLHHQIKRMFLRFNLRVIQLHRESIGPYQLGNLKAGDWRHIDFQAYHCQ